MTPQQLSELKSFLVEAAANGYANDVVTKVRQSDGSDTIHYEKDDWRFDDNYFTSSDGRRFYGRETVYLAGKPYWYMGYAGFVDDTADTGQVYEFLKIALREPDEEMPIRGPLSLDDGDWQYALHPDTSLEQFYAAEWIKHDGKNVYLAHFHGGLID